EVFYGIRPTDGTKEVRFEARLRYRQADQHVAEALLAAVPKDIDLKETYGLDRVPLLPVVDMAVKEAAFAVRQ
ncbi:MAG TPA: cytochrome C, partial [Geobacteraceae bacterium]